MGYELNKLLNLYGVRSATQAQYGGADDPGAPPEVPDDLYAHIPDKPTHDADGNLIMYPQVVEPVYAPQPGDPNYDSYMDYQKSVEEYLPRKEEFDYDQEQYNSYVDEWNNRMLETDVYRDRQFAGLTPSPPVDGPNPPYFPGPIVPFQGDSTQGMEGMISPYRPPGWGQGMGSQWDSPLNLPVYQQDVIPPYVPPITFPEAPVIPPDGDTGNGGTVIDDTIYNDPIYDDPYYDAGFKYGGPIRGYQEGDSVNVDSYSPLTNPYGQGQVEEDLFFNEVEVGGPQRQTTLGSLQTTNPERDLFKARIEALGLRQDSLKQNREKEIELLRQIHDIKKSRLSSGSNAEFYFKLGEAFSKPTRTGNFFESLGNVSGVLAEDAKAKRMAQGAGQLGELQLERDILKLGREDITAADKLDTTVFGLKKAEIAASAPKKLSDRDLNKVEDFEDRIMAGEDAIRNLKKAMVYNKNSYPLGNEIDKLLFWKDKQLARFGTPNQKLTNTEEMLALVQSVVLSQLKSTFGARPSDAELRELQKTVGLESSTIQAREAIFKANIRQAEIRIKKLKARKGLITKGRS